VFYCDYFKRDTKSGGGVDEQLLTVEAAGHAAGEYNWPLRETAAGEPALISFTDVTRCSTSRHGAWHLLKCEYPLLRAPAAARLVSFPRSSTALGELSAVYDHFPSTIRSAPCRRKLPELRRAESSTGI